MNNPLTAWRRRRQRVRAYRRQWAAEGAALAAVRDAARDTPPGARLASAALAARAAGVQGNRIIRAAMAGPDLDSPEHRQQALTVAELALTGRCSYPRYRHLWPGCPGGGGLGGAVR